jgi:hypothetical protein
MLCGKITAPSRLLWTVHRVDAEHQRDRDVTWAGRQRSRVETAREFQPLPRRRTIVAIRTAIAAGENRAERVAREIFRYHCADVGLDNLADFVLEAHASDQFVDSRLGIRLDEAGAFRLRPHLRMHVGVCRHGRGARGREKERCENPGELSSGAGNHGTFHDGGTSCRQRAI